MDIVDTHCHLDVEEFDADRAAVLAAARRAGVTDIIIPGIYADAWPRLLALCAGDERLHPALGLHPVYLEWHRDGHIRELETLVERERPVAVGEIGLDWFVDDLDRERQQELFERQLGVARVARLPVLLHVRKAHDQVLATLRRIPVRGGIAHAFSGSIQQARQYIDLGFTLGFGGMLTFERSRRLRALARELPLEAIVLETDAPDLTVAAHQGERNSPAYLPDCLNALAQVKDLDPEEVAAVTSRTARDLLEIG